MKTVTVNMSDEQFDRFTTIARLMEEDAGDILLALASGELDSWDDAGDCVYFISVFLNDYIDEQGTAGASVEKLLNAARKEMTTEQLIAICEAKGSENFSYEPNTAKISELLNQGETLVPA